MDMIKRAWLFASQSHPSAIAAETRVPEYASRMIVIQKRRARVTTAVILAAVGGIYLFSFRALQQETFLNMDEETFTKLKKERELKVIEESLSKPR